VSLRGDDLVLLSKNREDCGLLEKQVQNIAKLITVRLGTEAELERFFPNVNAADRWVYVAELYWLRPLSKPFNLNSVPDFNERRYAPVQGFAQLEPDDALKVTRYLAKTNADVVLEILNNAEKPVPPAS